VSRTVHGKGPTKRVTTRTLTARLAARLLRVWSKDTSSDPENWSPSNPAWGQCAVTALVVQDLLGGELLRCTVGHISHYWNRLPSGEEVDLTCDQFGDAIEMRNVELRTRHYVLQFPDTFRRYEDLRRRLAEDLPVAARGR